MRLRPGVGRPSILSLDLPSENDPLAGIDDVEKAPSLSPSYTSEDVALPGGIGLREESPRNGIPNESGKVPHTTSGISGHGPDEVHKEKGASLTPPSAPREAGRGSTIFDGERTRDTRKRRKSSGTPNFSKSEIPALKPAFNLKEKPLGSRRFDINSAKMAFAEFSRNHVLGKQKNSDLQATDQALSPSLAKDKQTPKDDSNKGASPVNPKRRRTTRNSGGATSMPPPPPPPLPSAQRIEETAKDSAPSPRASEAQDKRKLSRSQVDAPAETSLDSVTGIPPVMEAQQGENGASEDTCAQKQGGEKSEWSKAPEIEAKRQRIRSIIQEGGTLHPTGEPIPLGYRQATEEAVPRAFALNKEAHSSPQAQHSKQQHESAGGKLHPKSPGANNAPLSPAEVHPRLHGNMSCLQECPNPNTPEITTPQDRIAKLPPVFDNVILDSRKRTRAEDFCDEAQDVAEKTSEDSLGLIETRLAKMEDRALTVHQRSKWYKDKLASFRNRLHMEKTAQLASLERIRRNQQEMLIKVSMYDF